MGEVLRIWGVHAGDRLGDSSILAKQQNTLWEVVDRQGEKRTLSDGMGPMHILLVAGGTLRLQKFMKTFHSYESPVPL